jgi:hypothetical protein
MNMKKIIIIMFTVVIPVLISGQGKFFGGNGDGFATATIINQALPLIIDNFEGQLEYEKVILSFTISGDELMCGIIIEKSREGIIFTKMDSISFQAGSYTAEKMVRRDKSSVPGNNYYRLRIVKCNGAFVYSKTIMLYVPMRNTFYYSSADRKLYYNLEQPGILHVYSSQGMLMVTKKLQAGSGGIFMNIKSTGLYFYRFAGKPAGKFIN